MDAAHAYSVLAQHTLGPLARAGRSRMPAPAHAPTARAAGVAVRAAQQQPSQVTILTLSVGYFDSLDGVFLLLTCSWVAVSACKPACMW
jgi:hypothetical protein